MVQSKNKMSNIVKVASKIIGTKHLSLADIYKTQVICTAHRWPVHPPGDETDGPE